MVGRASLQSLLLCCLALPAWASEPAPAPLRFEPAREITLLVSSAALAIAGETFLKDALAPRSCRWCDETPEGVDRLNRLDAWAEGIQSQAPYQDRANLASNVLAYGLLPLSVLGADFLAASKSGQPELVLQDGAIILESVLLATVFNQMVKMSFGRQRPFVRALPPEQRGLTDRPADNNLSFYSGHTSQAFSIAVSAGVVAHMRGYRYRGLVWAVGLPLAAAMPLLRMAGARHYLSDVLAGAVMGSAFGVAVPLLLHPRTQALPIQASASRHGLRLSGSF